MRWIERNVDSQELAEWIAYTKYFEAIPDPWRQTALQVCATISPYSEKHKAPKVDDFNPIEKPPQHPMQMQAEIEKLLHLL